jgi:hypothetical protein
LNLIIQHESYRQNYKFFPNHFKASQFVNEMRLCSLSLALCKGHSNYILRQWTDSLMRCFFHGIYLQRNIKNIMVANVKTRFTLGSTFCNLIPSNYTTIFQWQKSQLYIIRATWTYSYFGAKEEVLKHKS